jgi:hypothetical protein
MSTIQWNTIGVLLISRFSSKSNIWLPASWRTYYYPENVFTVAEFMNEGAVEGRGLGAALRPLVDLGQSLGGGPGGEAPGSWRIITCERGFFLNQGNERLKNDTNKKIQIGDGGAPVGAGTALDLEWVVDPKHASQKWLSEKQTENRNWSCRITYGIDWWGSFVDI